MGPLPSNSSSSELFRQPLIEMLNPKHPLVKLADVIDWPTIEQSFGAHFASTRARPALPPFGTPTADELGDRFIELGW